jgi:hypothetical protein
VACLSGCGGIVASAPPGVDAEADNTDGSDATSSELTCAEGRPSLALRLPCLLSPDLPGDGGVSRAVQLLECDLATSSVRRAVGVFVSLARLAGELNEEVRIPFDGLPEAPGYPLQIEGIAVFTEVDSAARTLTGRLFRATIRNTNEPSGSGACPVGAQAIRAVPGNFRR